MVMATLPIIRLVLSIFRPDDRSVAVIIAVCMVVGFLEMLFIYTLVSIPRTNIHHANHSGV